MTPTWSREWGSVPLCSGRVLLRDATSVRRRWDRLQRPHPHSSAILRTYLRHTTKIWLTRRRNALSARQTKCVGVSECCRCGVPSSPVLPSVSVWVPGESHLQGVFCGSWQRVGECSRTRACCRFDLGSSGTVGQFCPPLRMGVSKHMHTAIDPKVRTLIFALLPHFAVSF